MVQSWLQKVAKPYAEKAKWKVSNRLPGCLYAFAA